jgi:hypothetical protein
MAGEALTSAVSPPSGPRTLSAGLGLRERLSSARARQALVLLRPWPLIVLASWILQQRGAAPEAARAESDRARALAIALAGRGLHASPDEIHFIPPAATFSSSPLPRSRAVVRARRPNEPADIYVVEGRVSPEGSLLELERVFNVSETSVVDEQQLIVSDQRAAWTIAQDSVTSNVQSADFRGEPRPSGPGWNWLSRLQNALTNLQKTGQFEGIGRRAFRLEPPAYKVVLGFSEQALLIDADSHKIRVPYQGAPSEGAGYVREQTPPKARPGNLVTWAVDRVRALPWFGDERMQWLKAVAFDGVDQFEQIVGSVTGDDGSSTVAEELGDLYAAAAAEATNPETGWPPAPMEPLLNPPLKGEGQWASLEKDPFVGRNPDAPSPFVVSFIRSDKKRIYSQIFVVLWDPRQVELHAMSGTVEPISATGETGPGLVPRKPEVLSRYVGAFNGGFQAVHGEFGMMSERVVYLPPKPYGATVAELEDGSTAFGTWPEDAPIPDNVVSYRQNMTPLIVGDEINPYKRHWWGGVPPGWTEESRTVRSGLCMTKEGFVGYFYGASVDPDVLALGMKRARCTYGIHLDMNAGHTGFEFYRAAPAGKLPALGRKLEDVWEARGAIPDVQGWEFMARRMIKYMALMNFPRYIEPEARDFFYLTLRSILPGKSLEPALTPAEPGEGSWRVQGLPQHGWPYAIATTNLRPEPARPETRVGLIKIDERLVRVAHPGDAEDKLVIEFRTPSDESDEPIGLWHSERSGFSIGKSAPDPSASRITTGFLAEHAKGRSAAAAMGVDPDGKLIYARITEAPSYGEDAALLTRLLTRLGCETKLLLSHPLGALMGGQDETANSPARGKGGVKLLRAAGPGAKSLFAETPIVPPKRWAPLQQKRVRYK